MKAARLIEPFRFEVATAPRPRPEPAEVLVRIEGCGVCGSNLPPWRGENGTRLPLDPGSLGHEAWGWVEDAGDEVADQVRPGQKAAFLSYRSFAEFDTVPVDRLVALPDSLSGVDLPGEPLACAVNVARRSGVAEGDAVVVVGIGFLGALLLPLLRRAGAERIVAVSRRRTSLDMAERMGADEVLDYEEAEAVLLGDDGQAADVVVEATGLQGPLDLAARLCRVRGRLIIAGYHQDGPRQVDMQLWNWRGLDVVNAHERDPARYLDGMRRALQLVDEGVLDPGALITHREPLAHIQRAFRAADERPEGFFKAVVLPGAEA